MIPDDEREELARLVFPIAAHATPGAFAYGIADRAILSGFRRSEVPEPSAEMETEMHARGATSWDCPDCGNDPEDCYCGNDPEDCYCGSEPQGEPSDAQVAAAVNAHRSNRSLGDSTEYTSMRAALRAAWAKPQGEPSNAMVDPNADCTCGHGRHTHLRYAGGCGLCDCPSVRAAGGA